MSKLTDLAIKKLAMRKESGEFDYNPIRPHNFAYLYSRAGWPTMSPDNEPMYSNDVVQANNLPWAEGLGNIINKFEANPFNPNMPVVPSRTGYPNIKDYKALLYNSMMSGFTPTEAVAHQNKIFNPIASGLAYPGSAVETNDKRFENLDKTTK